jgi:hypothetical protein
MASHPPVSVIVPCYNAAATLSEALDSAFGQGIDGLEVIVVDDGSCDRSAEVAERYLGRGLVLVRQANAGAAAARNRGMAVARGEHLQFLDADDLLAPGKIAAQLAALREAGPGAVAFGRWGRFVGSCGNVRFRDDDLNRDWLPAEFLRFLYAHNRMMHPAAWLVPRAVASAAGPWDESLSLDDDGEYFCRVALAAERLLFVPGATSLYRSGNESSLSQRRSPRAWRSAFDAATLSVGHLVARDGAEASRRAGADRLQRLLFEMYPEQPELLALLEAKIRELGGSTVQPEGGGLFRLSKRVLGWRAARRLDRGTHALRRRLWSALRRHPR